MKELLLTALLLLPGNSQVAVKKTKKEEIKQERAVCEVPKKKETPKPCDSKIKVNS